MIQLCSLPDIIGQADKNLTEQEYIKRIDDHRKHITKNGIQQSHFGNEHKVDGDNGFCRNDHQHHDDRQPSFTKRKLDLRQGITCQAVDDHTSHDHDCCIEQCICHKPEESCVEQNFLIVIEKSLSRCGRNKCTDGIHICCDRSVRFKRICNHPNDWKQEE